MKTTKKINDYFPSEIYKRVLYYFFAFPEQAIGLNDLSNAISVSKTATKEIVLQLEKEGFLKKEIIGRAWRILSNQDHHYLISRKVPIHLQIIYESGIIDIIRQQIPSARAIILFGSYRWGSDNEKSDIDIAVEIIGDKEPKIISFKTLEYLGYRKNVPVNLYIFSRNKIDLNLFNNIANGIVIYGFLEVRPWEKNILIQKMH